jgi:carbon-monoxide dehydrogenase small subunit
MKIDFTLNGEQREIDVAPMSRLLDVLRCDFELTGSKEGCGEGECGACTVFVDGKAVNSCLIPVAQMQGREVRTVESLASNEMLSDVQQALIKFGGTQCGICTPGIAMMAFAALEAEPNASRARMRELMAGNLCRCTGYQLIIDAVISAAEARRSHG